MLHFQQYFCFRFGLITWLKILFQQEIVSGFIFSFLWPFLSKFSALLCLFLMFVCRVPDFTQVHLKEKVCFDLNWRDDGPLELNKIPIL